MKAISLYFTFLATVSISLAHGNTTIPTVSHTLQHTSKCNSGKFKKPEVYSDDNTAVTLMAPYKKTVEEVMAEDRKIIGYATNTKTQNEIERLIRENNKITESATTDVFCPLEPNIQKTLPVQMLIKL